MPPRSPSGAGAAHRLATRSLATALALALAACDSSIFTIYDGGLALDAEPIDAGPPANACPSFDIRVFELAPRGAAFVALPLDESTVLVGTRDGDRRWYAVTESGALALAAETPTLSPLSGKLTGDELWIAGDLRSLAHGTFDRAAGFTLTNVATPPEALRFLDVSPPDQPLEAFAIGQLRGEGNLHRFDGSSWQTIWRRRRPYTPQSPDYGAVLYVGPNEAFAIPRGSECNDLMRCVLHVDPTTGTVIEQPSDSSELLTALASIPEIGLLAGNRHNQLLRYDGAGWRVIEGAPLVENLLPAQIVRHILPYRTGAIFFTDRRVFHWSPDTGYCADPMPFGDAISALYAVVPIQSGFVLTGGAPDDRPLQIVVLIDR